MKSFNSYARRFDAIHTEYVFLALALCAGLYMVFVTGPFQAPDEPIHFFRAYQISEGQVLGTRIGDKTGGWLPEEIFNVTETVRGVAFHADKKIPIENMKKVFIETFDGKKRVFVVFPVVYPPFCYLPQAMGIAAGRLCGLSAMGMAYAGRLASLLCWIGFVFSAIQLTPAFKWVIVLVALMPMTIFLASSLSADTMIISCSILFAAIVLRGATAEGKLSPRLRITLMALCIIISMMKLVYFPLVSLVFIIPSGRFGGIRNKALYCMGVVAVSFVAAALWSFEMKRVYMHLNNSNMGEQLSFILADPRRYIALLWKTMLNGWYAYLVSFTGVLGWLDTWIPIWIYRTYYLMLIGTALIDGGGTSSLSYRNKTFLAGTCWLIVILIATSQYLIWTEPGAYVLEGVQGRYFIPLAVPTLLILYNRKTPNFKNFFAGGVITIFVVAVLISTCFTIYQRYYG
jgi:uncharacterized membrane protein